VVHLLAAFLDLIGGFRHESTGTDHVLQPNWLANSIRLARLLSSMISFHVKWQLSVSRPESLVIFFSSLPEKLTSGVNGPWYPLGLPSAQLAAGCRCEG
jgi:hypothetical protein